MVLRRLQPGAGRGAAAGLIGDRIGRKKLLLIALVLFGVASAACAFSTSSAELIAARAVLGLGAAAIFPMSIAVLPVLFTEEERPRAIAVIMGGPSSAIRSARCSAAGCWTTSGGARSS